MTPDAEGAALDPALDEPGRIRVGVEEGPGRPAPVDAQCRWLAEAGLVDVDCFFKAWRFAVFGGTRPPT